MLCCVIGGEEPNGTGIDACLPAYGGVQMTPAKTRRARVSSADRKRLNLKIEPFGPNPADIEALAQRVTKHRAVQAMLAKTRHRLLHIDVLDSENDDKVDRRRPPDRRSAITS